MRTPQIRLRRRRGWRDRLRRKAGAVWLNVYTATAFGRWVARHGRPSALRRR